MPRRLTSQNLKRLHQLYSYLTNYQTEDSCDPIDPMLYVDSNGDGLLHIAAAAGDLESVKILIKTGIDPNLLGDMGNTALHYAINGKHQSVASFLIDSGAKKDITNEFGVSADRNLE